MQHIDGCRDYNGSINCRIQSTVADFKLEAGWLFLEWNRHVQLTRHDPVSFDNKRMADVCSTIHEDVLFHTVQTKRQLV